MLFLSNGKIFEKSGLHCKSFICKYSQDEGNVQELKEQLEALTAHVDYVQENITDCQTSIMEMEVRPAPHKSAGIRDYS